MTVAYRRRKMDAAFRAAWVEAIAVAYQRLELVLLERAFNGTEKVIPPQDGSEERMREYSNQLGLTLLKMHRDTRDRGGKRACRRTTSRKSASGSSASCSG